MGLKIICPGYIGLHRNIGDLSNVAIKGFMKHAWLHVDETNIVEAVSEGVLKQHAFHALMSDFVTIHTPMVDTAARQEAVKRANYLAELKLPYDDDFKFDLEIEESLFADKEVALSNMKHYDLGASCTEAVALCYVGHRRALGLYRDIKGFIMPDAYLTTHFPIVWASKSATADNAKKLGLHDEGCDMLSQYWSNKGV